MVIELELLSMDKVRGVRLMACQACHARAHHGAFGSPCVPKVEALRRRQQLAREAIEISIGSEWEAQWQAQQEERSQVPSFARMVHEGFGASGPTLSTTLAHAASPGASPGASPSHGPTPWPVRNSNKTPECSPSFRPSSPANLLTPQRAATAPATVPMTTAGHPRSAGSSGGSGGGGGGGGGSGGGGGGGGLREGSVACPVFELDGGDADEAPPPPLASSWASASAHAPIPTPTTAPSPTGGSDAAGGASSVMASARSRKKGISLISNTGQRARS